MDKQITQFVSSCLTNGYISEDQAPWLHYAIEKRVVFIMVAIPFWLVGMYISSPKSATAFLLCFYFLRERTSGFHANNPKTCLFFSLISECIFLGVLPKVVDSKSIALITLISVIYIFYSAPFRCLFMNLSKQEVITCKYSSRIRVIVMLSIYYVCSARSFYDVAVGISSGIVMTACGLVIAYINQKGEIYMKKQHEKKTRLPAKVLSALADKEAKEWPPTCLGFFYQPTRPQNIMKSPKKESHMISKE